MSEEKNWYLTWYTTFDKLKRSEATSAAWKASAKFNRDKLLIELDRVKRLIAEWFKLHDRAIAAEKRVAELEDALMSLLDGLDSNYDERCGLTNKEWEQRISEARTVLNK